MNTENQQKDFEELAELGRKQSRNLLEELGCQWCYLTVSKNMLKCENYCQ